jgi:hypothetical protein
VPGKAAAIACVAARTADAPFVCGAFLDEAARLHRCGALRTSLVRCSKKAIFVLQNVRTGRYTDFDRSSSP